MVFRIQWKSGDVFLKDVRVVIEDIGNILSSWENVDFGFRIKEELQEAVKKC